MEPRETPGMGSKCPRSRGVWYKYRLRRRDYQFSAHLPLLPLLALLLSPFVPGDLVPGADQPCATCSRGKGGGGGRGVKVGSIVSGNGNLGLLRKAVYTYCTTHARGGGLGYGSKMSGRGSSGLLRDGSLHFNVLYL